MQRSDKIVDISLVILTWNSERHIGKCLESTLSDLNGSRYSYEIYLVDNGSKDGTVALIEEMVRRHAGFITPIYLERNAGTTFSRNLALRRAKGKYVCIMDSDVIAGPGVFQGLIDILESDSSIGLVAPKLVYPNGRLQKSTDDFPTLFTKIKRFLWLKNIERREADKMAIAKPVPVDYAISAVWMMKRELLEKVGFLDENIFYSPEDADYCLRSWIAGYKVVYVPGVMAFHEAQEISRGLRITRNTIQHFKGLSYYFMKHKYFLRNPQKTKPLKVFI